MEMRHVDYEQVGALTAYLLHLAEATTHFADATSENRATANRIHDALIEQSYQYGDEDTGESLRPEFEGDITPYTLDEADWAFMERWFTNPERMDRWALEAIGQPLPKTRILDWAMAETILDTLDCSQRRDPDAPAVRDALLDQLPQDYPDTFLVRLLPAMWHSVDRLCPEVEFITPIADCELILPDDSS